jgi:hypothetical protein
LICFGHISVAIRNPSIDRFGAIFVFDRRIINVCYVPKVAVKEFILRVRCWLPSQLVDLTHVLHRPVEMATEDCPWCYKSECLLSGKQMFQNKAQKVTLGMVRQKSIWIQTTGLQLGRALPDI